MEISEYRPDPRPSPPSKPPRKDRTVLIACLLLAGTFIGTLIVLDWQQLTHKQEHVDASVQPPQGNLVKPATPAQAAQAMTEAAAETPPPPMVVAAPPAK